MNYQLLSRLCSCSVILCAAYSLSAQKVFPNPQTTTSRTKARRVAEVAGDKPSIADKAFAEGERLCAEGDADSCRRALKKYTEAVALWKTLGDNERQAKALRAVGQIYSRLGQPRKALEYFTTSLKLCQGAASNRCEIAARNELSAVLLTLGDVNESLAHCSDALRLSRQFRDRAGEAQALNNIGEVYYFRGDHEKAIQQYEQSLPIWKELNDAKGEAQTLLYLGYSHADLSNAKNAVESYERALTLWRAANDIRGQALTLTAIGHLHNGNGETQQALDHYDRAMPLLRRAGDRLVEARALNGMGFIYKELGDLRRALEYYHQARRLFREIDYKSGEATNLLLIARVDYLLGDYLSALNHYQESLAVVRVLADERTESYLLGDIAMVHASMGDTHKALDYCQRALALNRKLKDRNRESYTLCNIAYLHERFGEKQQALETYERALELTISTGDRPAQSLTLYHVARVSRDLGNLDHARTRIEEALEISDTLRTKVSGHEMRALYFATVHQLHEFYIDVLMRLYSTRKDHKFMVQAFEASERGRARSLLETLAEGRADIREGVDAKLLLREQDLQRRISALTEQRIQSTEGETSPEKVKALEKQLEALATEYQQVQGHIRASSPRYAALVQPVLLPLQRVQQEVLDSETMLLQYALGDERSFVWAVTQDSIKSFDLPSRSEIERSSRRVYDLLTARNLTVSAETPQQKRVRVRLSDDEFADAAGTLAKMILGPVAAELKVKRLVIVADGALHYVPFAALPSPLKPKVDASSSTSASVLPLVFDHEVVLLPSTSTLALMRQELRGRQRASKTIAVLADAVFDIADNRLVSARQTRNASGSSGVGPENKALRSFDGLNQGAGISRLPFSRREAEAIMALVPATEGMMALGFSANRATVIGPELSRYRYVHFATHGLLNSEHPDLSGILLSRYDKSGRRQNGFLQLHDVYNMKLSADLVVLSACQTALGKDIRGEGLVGLTRGFMYAGAPRVVASLWQVDDAATADLMREFYTAMLTEGKRPAEALRAAQVRMWEQNRWPSPYYWAAFTLQGEWR